MPSSKGGHVHGEGSREWLVQQSWGDRVWWPLTRITYTYFLGEGSLERRPRPYRVIVSPLHWPCGLASTQEVGDS